MLDWKGDPVRSPVMIFGPGSRITIPVEFTDETSLLAYLGVSADELKKIWWFRHGMYRDLQIVKRNGKVRQISAPDQRLKGLQRKIATSLNSIYSVRHPVHGFVTGKSVKTNAQSHVRNKFLLNIDLQDFFPTITEKRVMGVFRSLGIDKRVSEILARISCNYNMLPQGAPTSPVVSNLICFRMDKALLAFAKEARCIYTRYADDISFSGYRPLSGLFEAALPSAGTFLPDLLSKKLREIIESNGFQVNREKAHYADKHTRRTVTGVKINEGLNVDRRFVRNLRSALYSVGKQGLAAAQAKYTAKYSGKASLASHLRGKLIWLRHIKGQTDPVFRQLALRFNELFPAEAINVLPTQAEVQERAVWIVEHEGNNGEQGTAFFLRGFGLVTAAHCMSGAIKPIVYHPSRPAIQFEVSMSRNCDDRDLAILSHLVPGSNFLELEVSTDEIVALAPTTALGYPDFARGHTLNRRPGTVHSLSVSHCVQQIEVSQLIANGMSGGPLIDNMGKVIGISHKGGPDEHRNLCVHVRELVALAK